jgi:hypothetical protein
LTFHFKFQIRPGSRLSERSQRFERELFLQTYVTLFAGDKVTEHALDTAMSARERDHSLSEWRAPEVSVKTPAHL